MKRFGIFSVVLVLFSFLLTSAIAVHAGGGGYVNPINYRITQLTVPRLYGASVFYGSGVFLANDNQGNVFKLDNGAWADQGFKLWSPVWSESGVYGYNPDGFPSVFRDGQTTILESSAQFSKPLIRPSIGPSGQVSFGRMPIDFVLTIKPDGSSTACLPFSKMSGAWWVVDVAYATDSVIYYSGQSTSDPVNDGYRVVGKFYGGLADTGMVYSEIAISNAFLWGVSPYHDFIDGWQLDANGSVIRSKRVMTEGYFNILGTDDSGVVFQQGSLYWHAAPVPEPGSLLALATGLIGLIGCGLRRR